MQSKTVTVENISCGHCTHTIEMELGDLVGVQKVKADMDNRQVVWFQRIILIALLIKMYLEYFVQLIL